MNPLEITDTKDPALQKLSYRNRRKVLMLCKRARWLKEKVETCEASDFCRQELSAQVWAINCLLTICESVSIIEQ
jgi:hypothetical protein